MFLFSICVTMHFCFLIFWHVIEDNVYRVLYPKLRYFSISTCVWSLYELIYCVLLGIILVIDEILHCTQWGLCFAGNTLNLITTVMFSKRENLGKFTEDISYFTVSTSQNWNIFNQLFPFCFLILFLDLKRDDINQTFPEVFSTFLWEILTVADKLSQAKIN